jgi:hypothetical protein
VEFGQRRDLAVPPPLHAAEVHGEVFDPTLGRRESEENKPNFALPYGRAKNRMRQIESKRYEQTSTRGFRVTRLR